MIEDALEMSRIENGKFLVFEELADLREAVTEVTDIMRFQIEQKGLQMITNFTREVPKLILCDIKRLKQVIFNLVGNAIKFTYKGSITVSMRVEGSEIVADVIDTGLGIDKEDLKKLFQFFGKLSKNSDINRGGMGLGLTISKMIIQKLGGQISVISTPNQGSTFTFTLPIKQ